MDSNGPQQHHDTTRDLDDYASRDAMRQMEHPFPDVDADISPYQRPAEMYVLERYVAILRRLRGPGGCPWDRKQTLHTLRRFIVEESFELLAAINDGDDDDISEELGDVFLVAFLIADALESERGRTLIDVFLENGSKLIRRHPHVFDTVRVDNSDEVVANWNQIKSDQEGRSDDPSGVGNGLPPLERAYEIQKKAAKNNFDWQPDDFATPIEKIREEINELEERVTAIGADSEPKNARDDAAIEKEIGDILFSVVNVSRRLKTDPSVALARSNDEFLKRFRFIRERVEERGATMKETPLKELDRLWNEAKRVL